MWQVADIFRVTSAYLRRFVPIAAAGAEGATLERPQSCKVRANAAADRPPSLPHREHRSTSTLTLNPSLNLSPIQVAVAALRIRVHVALQPRRQMHSGRGKVATTRARRGMHRRAGPTGRRPPGTRATDQAGTITKQDGLSA